MNEDPAGIPRTINAWQLTGLLVGVSSLFFGLAMLLSRTIPARPEAQLAAEVQVKVDVWAPEDGAPPRLLPCVELINPTDDRWRNVVLALDRQFYYYHASPLEAGQEMRVPLEAFITKGGNIHFRPATQSISQVTVYAQLSNGERGVFELEGVRWGAGR
jgi:hypothetical protein